MLNSILHMLSWIQPQFLLNSYPGPFGFGHGLWLAVIFLLILIFAVFARLYSNKAPDKAGSKWWHFVFYWCIWAGIVGEILVFFAWQEIPYFAMRLWLAVWIVGLLGWAIWLGWWRLAKLPKRRSAAKAKKEFYKYLPTRKR